MQFRKLLLILAAFFLLPVSCQNANESSANEKQARALMREYFQTWSEANIDAYEKLFTADAQIHFIDKNNGIESYALAPFIEFQRRSHADKNKNIAEYAEKLSIDCVGLGCQVRALWKMTSNGAPLKEGWDFFTLVLNQNDELKISYLLFWNH